MSKKFTTWKQSFLTKKIDINKKMLFTNFWMPAIPLIITVLVANAFAPIEKAITVDGKTEWISSIIKLDDVNMIAYIVLVSVIALAGVWLISLRLFRAREDIKSIFKDKRIPQMMVFFSSIIALITCLLFAILIIALPLVTANLREHIIISQENGKILSIIKPEINTTVYFIILIPVFIGILPLSYSAGLALFFEIQKRKNKITYFTN